MVVLPDVRHSTLLNKVIEIYLREYTLPHIRNIHEFSEYDCVWLPQPRRNGSNNIEFKIPFGERPSDCIWIEMDGCTEQIFRCWEWGWHRRHNAKLLLKFTQRPYANAILSFQFHQSCTRASFDNFTSCTNQIQIIHLHRVRWNAHSAIQSFDTRPNLMLKFIFHIRFMTTRTKTQK